MSRWTDLKVSRPFYKQTASCLYLLDALLGGSGSSRLTFSDVSGLPDAQVCMFIVREQPKEFGFNFLFRKSVGTQGSFSKLEELCSLYRTEHNKGAGRSPLGEYSGFSAGGHRHVGKRTSK